MTSKYILDSVNTLLAKVYVYGNSMVSKYVSSPNKLYNMGVIETAPELSIIGTSLQNCDMGSLLHLKIK